MKDTNQIAAAEAAREIDDLARDYYSGMNELPTVKRIIQDAIEKAYAEGVHDTYVNYRDMPRTAAEAEQLARAFHNIYERLAPYFGYETRKETREFDPSTPNGRLMIAVCIEIQNTIIQTALEKAMQKETFNKMPEATGT